MLLSSVYSLDDVFLVDDEYFTFHSHRLGERRKQREGVEAWEERRGGSQRKGKER